MSLKVTSIRLSREMAVKISSTVPVTPRVPLLGVLDKLVNIPGDGLACLQGVLPLHIRRKCRRLVDAAECLNLRQISPTGMANEDSSPTAVSNSSKSNSSMTVIISFVLSFAGGVTLATSFSRIAGSDPPLPSQQAARDAEGDGHQRNE